MIFIFHERNIFVGGFLETFEERQRESEFLFPLANFTDRTDYC